jgi:hypothetical protein
VAAALFATAAIAALIAGSPYMAGALLVFAVFVVGLWALVSAADRQYGRLRGSSYEQKQAWREAAEGKMVRIDIPWRHGGGGGF